MDKLDKLSKDMIRGIKKLYPNSEWHFSEFCESNSKRDGVTDLIFRFSGYKEPKGEPRENKNR